MAYTINKTDGTVIDTILDGVISQDTDLKLIGKNVPNYGEPINENFVRLLENFANTTPPGKPLVGELWYDTSAECVKVYTANNVWEHANNVIISNTAPAQSTPGSLWFDPDREQLLINNDGFKYVGPESAGADYGVTRLRSTSINESTGALDEKPIIKGYINNEILFIIAGTQFNTALGNFSTLRPGINLSPNVSLIGNVIGNATTATRLTDPVNINGVAFNGSASITIQDNSKLSLSGGTLTGPLRLSSSAPTLDTHAASKKYVDDSIPIYAAVFIDVILVDGVYSEHIIRHSHNVESVTRVSQGEYDVVFVDGTFEETGYVAVGTIGGIRHHYVVTGERNRNHIIVKVISSVTQDKDDPAGSISLLCYGK